MALAGKITAGVMISIFVGSREFVAGSSPLAVDLATHLLPNLPLKGNAAKAAFLACALHP